MAGIGHRGFMGRRQATENPLPPFFSGWSIRKANPSYSGFCMTVENITSGGTLDVGFVDGLLDTASILSWAGSDQVGVRDFYDQSGNGYHFQQTTPSLQPLIADGGIVYEINSNPALYFDGTGRRMSVPSSQAIYKFLHDGSISTQTFVSLQNIISPTRTMFIWGTTNNTSSQIGAFFATQQQTAQNNGISRIFRGTAGQQIFAGSNTSFAPSTQRLIFNVFDADAATQADRAYWYSQGVLAGTGQGTITPNTGNSSQSLFLSNSPTDTSTRFDGFIQELIIWNNDQTADIIPIQDNINDYFSIY